MASGRISRAEAESSIQALEAMIPLYGPKEQREMRDYIGRLKDHMIVTELLDSGELEWCRSCQAEHLVKWDEERQRYVDFHIGRRTMEALRIRSNPTVEPTDGRV